MPFVATLFQACLRCSGTREKLMAEHVQIALEAALALPKDTPSARVRRLFAIAQALRMNRKW